MGQMGFLELQHSVHTGAPCTTSNSPTSLGLIPDSRGVPACPLPQMLGTSHNKPGSHVTPPTARHQTPTVHSPMPMGSPCCRSPTPHGTHPHAQNLTARLGTTLPSSVTQTSSVPPGASTRHSRRCSSPHHCLQSCHLHFVALSLRAAKARSAPAAANPTTCTLTPQGGLGSNRAPLLPPRWG